MRSARDILERLGAAGVAARVYCEADPCDFLPFDMDDFLRFFAETYPSMPSRFDLGSPVG